MARRDVGVAWRGLIGLVLIALIPIGPPLVFSWSQSSAARTAVDSPVVVLDCPAGFRPLAGLTSEGWSATWCFQPGRPTGGSELTWLPGAGEFPPGCGLWRPAGSAPRAPVTPLFSLVAHDVRLQI
ncbi:MAG: hypothetical protein J5I93_05120 [Pirellulaceae bacterium]|nr:hypothetical protein [Pirellulaceae bacterium]